MTRTTWWGPLLWTVYVLIPIAGWGLLDGVPLAPVEAVVLAAIWWTWGWSRQLGPAWLVAACLGLKVASAVLLVPQGFSASYFANSEFTAPIEQSVEYRDTDATRVDRRLAFGRPGAPDLPLYFFNDVSRFNFYQGGQPHRARLPFSVVWDGYVWVEEGERAHTFYLKATALEGSLELDGAPLVTLAPGEQAATASALYAKGWRRLVVRVAGRDQVARDFEAGSVDASGREQPFGSLPVYRAPVSRRAMQVDGVVRAGSRAIDVGLVAMLGWFTLTALAAAIRQAWNRRGDERRHAMFALAIVAAMAEATRFAWPAVGRLILQAGGDDPLTYQTYARDIVFNGPLMLMGGVAGQVEPYYYQPLYAYVLAASHLVFGEGLFGAFFLQRLAMGLAILGLSWMAHRLDGPRAGVLTAAIGTGLFFFWVDRWAAELWTETVFLPLVVAWTCLLLRSLDAGARWHTAILAGLAGGLAVLGRSTLLLAVPPVMILMWLALPPARRRGLLVMLAVMAAVVSLATLRNFIASGTVVPITTSFGVNLYLGNEPPRVVPRHPAGEHALDRWLAGNERTRPVLEFARHAPREFLANLWRKGQYAFGYFDPFVPGAGWSLVLVAWWMTAVAGFMVLLRSPRHDAARPRAEGAIPMAIAASMFAAIIAIFPHHTRLYLPGYLMLLPCVGIAAARLIGLGVRTAAGGAASPTPTA